MRLKSFIHEGSQHLAKIRGKTIRVIKPKRARNEILVNVKVDVVDKAFSRIKSFYIGKDGKGGIGNRYERFGFYINGGVEDIDGFELVHEPHDEIESSEMYIDDKGMVSFDNGRHRWAWLRDHGAKTIPVSMPKDAVENAKKFGYLA